MYLKFFTASPEAVLFKFAGKINLGLVKIYRNAYVDKIFILYLAKHFSGCIKRFQVVFFKGKALRQCSPFTGILSNRERFEFLREWKAAHAA